MFSFRFGFGNNYSTLKYTLSFGNNYTLSLVMVNQNKFSYLNFSFSYGV